MLKSIHAHLWPCVFILLIFMQVGKHGIIIEFIDPDNNTRRSATYLPEVAAHEGSLAFVYYALCSFPSQFSFSREFILLFFHYTLLFTNLKERGGVLMIHPNSSSLEGKYEGSSHLFSQQNRLLVIDWEIWKKKRLYKFKLGRDKTLFLLLCLLVYRSYKLV